MICSEGEIPLTARNLEFVCSCGGSVGITTISNTRGLQFDSHQPLWTWTCSSSTLGKLKKKENRTGFSHRSYRDCKSIWLKEHCSWCRGLVYKNVLGNSFVGQMAKWRGMFLVASLKFLNHWFQQSCQSLNKLGFEEEADALSRIAFAPGRGSFSLRELLVETSRPVLEGLARRSSFNVDVDKYLRDLTAAPRKTPRGPVHLARNFYIFDKVCFTFDLRSFGAWP